MKKIQREELLCILPVDMERYANLHSKYFLVFYILCLFLVNLYFGSSGGVKSIDGTSVNNGGGSGSDSE